MTTLLGWTLIVVMLSAFSLVFLWPALRYTRRARADFAGAIWAYVAAAAVFSLVLWYAIPPAVHWLFGRVAH